VKEITTDVSDILSTKFAYTTTGEVPSDGDPGLSYESGKEKRGKEIETCVLYVDIRGSVELSQKLGVQSMGKIYTSFVKSVIKAGRYHGGHTRNIIGDRVMIVFPKKNCFTNAVSCAVSINHIASQVINPKLGGDKFRCGIGIDHGIMRVIKVGVPRRGQEANPNRGLVWAGEPANIASRLTDRANKTVAETVYDIRYNPINPDWFPVMRLSSLFGHFGDLKKYYPQAIPRGPYHLSSIETKTLSEKEFASMFASDDKSDTYSTLGGKLLSFNRREVKTTYSAILMTESVMKGLLAEKLDASLLPPSANWQLETDPIPNVSTKVYGGGFWWKL